MHKEQQSGKMWSGRFRAAADPFFDLWQRSIRFDYQLLNEELAASKAHALVLQAAGILSHDECACIAGALDDLRNRYATSHAEIRDDSEAEDIHHFVERRLTGAIGDLALKLHTGRSRNEQIATDLRLYIRFRIRVLVAHLAAWASQLVLQAQSAGDA